MKWYHCERTDVGKKHFSPQFRYCRGMDDGRLLFSDGGLAWVTLKAKWAKLMFVCGKQMDEDISKAIEETYQRTL